MKSAVHQQLDNNNNNNNWPTHEASALFACGGTPAPDGNAVITKGWTLDRVSNSRRPLDRLFALCDPDLWPFQFSPNINGTFVQWGLFCPGGQLLTYRIIIDGSCIKCFNDIVEKFVARRTVQSESQYLYNTYNYIYLTLLLMIYWTSKSLL